jgi:hypothetical protein
VTCEACSLKSYGAYDFNCQRCLARAYVRSFPREQRIASKRFRETLSAEEQMEIRRLLDEERAKENG